ncbi:MAG: 2-oxoacid:acceptor oxidoreductase subunit alpha [Planctomycetota bacterium]|jgi:2-oxoglutarate ferredoxin oxidoreductase subunit alpha
MTAPSVADRYLESLAGTEVFLLGDEAAAMGSIFAGCTFFGGYPITPASEIAEVMSRELPRVGGYYVQFEDELASISAVVGAAWAGARSMTATSGPGFSLMQETVGYACMTETPCVIVDVQRSGPSTGQATLPAQGDVMQARWGTHGDHEIIALAPSTVQECLDLMIRCFNLAERYRNPVIFLMDGEIGHLRERAVFPDPEGVERQVRRKAEDGELVFGGMEIPPMLEFGEGQNVHVTGSTHKADGMRDVRTQAVHDTLVRRLVKKIEDARDDIAEVEVDAEEGASVGVLAYGATARPARGAVLKARAEGRKVAFVRPITIWPFPIRQIRKACAGLDTLLVPEMNLGQLNREIERHVDCQVVSSTRIGGIPHRSSEIAAEIARVTDGESA